MLAVFSVSNLDDTGVGSLRTAISQANNNSGADEIVFSGAATSGVIDLSFAELEITDTLTISGPGENSLTIDAQQNFRAFNFTGSGDLTLKDLTITGGRTTGNNPVNVTISTHSGGGIRFAGGSFGELTLDRVTVSGNRTEGDFAKGGGVFSSGFTTLTDSTVSGNWTTDHGSRGGGIHSFRNLSLFDSTVSGNRTDGSHGFGGGVFSEYLVTLTNSTISGNSTTDNDARGGGIFSFQDIIVDRSTVSGNSTAGNDADGGGIAGRDVTLNNSSVSGNSTTGVDASGGGIFARGDVTLNHSTITGNSAAFRGGGVDLDNGPSEVTVSGSIVAGNTYTTSNTRSDIGLGAQGTLSASYSLLGTNVLSGSVGTNILSDNPLLGPLANNIGPTQTHALLPGSPAIDAGDPTIAFNASEFDQRGTPFVRVFDGGVDGARIDIGAFELQTLPASFLVVDSSSNIDDGDFSTGQFTLREAISLANLNPGADTILFDMAAAGGTMNLAGTELEITESLTIDATSIPITAGKPRIDADGGSRIFNITASTGDFTFAGLTLIGGRTTANFQHGGAIFSGTSGKLTLDRTSVNGNRTEGILAFGGGIYAEGDVMLRRSSMSGNTTTGNASAGGGIFSLGNVTLTDFSGISTSKTTGDNADGGGIRANGNVTLNNSQVNVNSTTGANSFGGAIRSRGDVTLNNSGVILNTTEGDGARGGGISADGNVTLVFANVVANSTLGDDATGGGIHATGDVIVIADTEVIGNTTEGDEAIGGGIYSDGDVMVTDSSVDQNSTAGVLGFGGGIFASGDVTLIDSTVADNSTAEASASGGGIHAVGSVLVTGSTLSGNSTTGLNAEGGGIYSKADVTLAQSTISGNSAAGASTSDGGGIYAVGTVSVSQSTVTGNSVVSDARGGGIWVRDGNITLNNSIVAGNSAAGANPPDVGAGSGTITVNFSLLGTTVSPDAGGNNLFNNNPMLGPLTNNGGPTETHALQAGSPAIDAGDPSIVFNPAEFDQRGAPFARVAAGRIDIGAIEDQPLPDSADFDTDGDVDGSDFLAWQRGFGILSPNANPTDGDANGDQAVDGVDLGIWESQFGLGGLSAINDQPSAFSAQQAELFATQAPAVARHVELIDAAMAIALIRDAQVEETPSLDGDPAFSETYTDHAFTAEAIAPAAAFSSESEPTEPGEDEDVKDSWLADELLERVFG